MGDCGDCWTGRNCNTKTAISRGVIWMSQGENVDGRLYLESFYHSASLNFLWGRTFRMFVFLTELLGMEGGVKLAGHL